MIKAPRSLKTKVIKAGLLNANLDYNFDSIDVISSVGDPFQAFSLGLLIGARIALHQAANQCYTNPSR